MKNFKLIKRMGVYALVGSLSFSHPLVAQASDYNKTKQEWLSKAKSLGKKAFDYSLKVEDKVYDKMRSLEVYEANKVWLITDEPTVNPEEKRNYYFVNGSFAKGKKTTYYDKYNHKVKDDSSKKAYATIERFYFIGADTEKGFMATDTINYKDYTVTTNYVDFNKDYLYDENLDVTYGRILDWASLLPESEIKETYSLEELRTLLDNYFNNYDYALGKEALTLRKQDI